MKVCAAHRCGELTEDTYCETHRKAKRRASDRRRPSAQARGYNAQHRKDRKAFLRANPICQWPEGCIAEATDLDHIDGNPFNKDWSNYRGLCSYHHKVRTARDQPGGWAA